MLAFGFLIAASTSEAADKGSPQIHIETAEFAGGCFWCMEPEFDKLKGIRSVVVGYTGGQMKNPTYKEVSSGTTGHAESILITYDPSVIKYTTLLDVFWHNIDPTVKDRQFCDVGRQYRSAIFYRNEAQKRLAEESKKNVEKLLGVPVYTEIVPASTFYPAEEYHQQYYKKNPIRYRYYRSNCGRDQRLKEIWEKKSNQGSS